MPGSNHNFNLRFVLCFTKTIAIEINKGAHDGLNCIKTRSINNNSVCNVSYDC